MDEAAFEVIDMLLLVDSKYSWDDPDGIVHYKVSDIRLQ